MANTNAPFGFVPYAAGGGAVNANFALRYVQISYNYGTKIFKGDMVKLMNTGYINVSAVGDGGGQLTGIFWGCEYLPLVGNYTWSPYWPGTSIASTSVVKAYIIPTDLSQYMWFLTQADATGLTQAAVGHTVDIKTGFTGSTSTGLSGMYLDSTTTATTSTQPWKIMRLYSDLGGLDNGSASGAYNKVFVAANLAGVATGTTT